MSDVPDLDGLQLAALLSLIVVMGAVGWSISRAGKFGVGVVIAKSLAVITIWVTFGLAVTGNEQLGNVALVAVGALAGALTQRSPHRTTDDATDEPHTTSTTPPTTDTPDVAPPPPTPPTSATPPAPTPTTESDLWP
jgi:hypothetical protein